MVVLVMGRPVVETEEIIIDVVTCLVRGMGFA